MSKVTANTESRQAMPIYLDDPIERVARAIFAYRYPQAAYTDPTFKEEVIDCRLLAAQFNEILNPRWTLSNAAETLTDQFCRLIYGDRILNTGTRAQVKDFAESCIEDAAKTFSADVRAVSESWKYVPENEPDDSELEVLPAKKETVQ